MSFLINSYRFAGGPWTPANLAIPPKIWLNDSSPITQTGSVCDQWNDISGNAWHFEAATTRRPTILSSDLAGRRVIQFDGNNDVMTSISARPIFQNVVAGWAITVYKKRGTAGSQTDTIFCSVNGVDNSSRFVVNAQGGSTNVPSLNVRRLDADSTGTLNAGGSVTNAWHMLLMTMDWGVGDGTIYIDGQQSSQNTSLTSSGSTSNTTASQSIGLGAYLVGTNPADVDIAEIVAGSGTALPSTTEIDKLFGYLAHRWGLTSLLDVSHPYKTTPPTI